MTPGMWLTLIKDLVIVVAIGFVLFILISYGKDITKLQDIAAVQTQIKAIAKSFNDWQATDSKAKEKQDATIKALSNRIDKQPPIIVHVTAPKASPSAVSGVQAGGSTSGPPAAGGSSGRPGEDRTEDTEDLRPGFNAAEHKYSKALAECWKIIATCKVPK